MHTHSWARSSSLYSHDGAQVDSRAGLAAAWQLDPSYLQPQLAAWVQRPHQRQLLQLWPQLLQQAASVAGRQKGSGGAPKSGTTGGKKKRAHA